MKIEKVVKIAEAVKSVEESKLDFKVAYRLGRILDKCESIVKQYQKQEMNLRQEFGSKFQDASEEDKPKIQAEFNTKFVELLEMEESIEIPQFSLKDFENKDLPVKFFSAFNEYIDDAN